MSYRNLLLFPILFTALTSHAQVIEKLTASSQQNTKRFGYSVDIQNNLAVVGAYIDDAVYVFERSATGWSLSTKLSVLPGTTSGFGSSIAIDGNVIVVGSVGDDNYKGSVYVFERNLGSWTHTARLLPHDRNSNEQAITRFGDHVATSGNRIVVSAEYTNMVENNPGAVYVFEHLNEGWKETAKLTASDGAPNDRFGSNVSIDGDLLVVVGESASYVFEYKNSSWIESAKLPISGYLSLSGNRIVFGQIDDNTFGYMSGAVYVYERTNGIWNQKSTILPSDGARGQRFGGGVSLSGENLAIGAYGDNRERGAVYRFGIEDDVWIEKQKLIADDLTAGDQFGAAVSTEGNVIVVGADRQNELKGAVYIFNFPDNPTGTDEPPLFSKEILNTEIFPNPFSTTAALTYTLHSPEHVKIRILDVLGRPVALVLDAIQTIGTYSIPIEGNNFVSGQYVVEVGTGAERSVNLITIVR